MVIYHSYIDDYKITIKLL